MGHSTPQQLFWQIMQVRSTKPHVSPPFWVVTNMELLPQYITFHALSHGQNKFFAQRMYNYLVLESKRFLQLSWLNFPYQNIPYANKCKTQEAPIICSSNGQLILSLWHRLTHLGSRDRGTLRYKRWGHGFESGQGYISYYNSQLVYYDISKSWSGGGVKGVFWERDFDERGTISTVFPHSVWK